MADKPTALRLAAFCDGNVLYHPAAAELRRLHGENEKLRAVIVLDDAEWCDKHIYPVGGAAYQAWLVRIYLPVPLSASDKSPEAALKRAIKERNK